MKKFFIFAVCFAAVLFASCEPTLTPQVKGYGFSVSSTKKVIFSPGNLQYDRMSRTWSFAENQYDIVGAGNANISSSNTGWIDLFGFGTSGYGESHPYNSGEYDSYPNSYSIGQISGTNYDWGYYNKISNGGGAFHR